MGDDFGLPIISAGAQDAMNITDNRLRERLGEASLGVARWIVGTPPPALILDLLLQPENIVGIYPQGPVGSHNYLLEFRSGYAAEKCSWVAANRPERMFPTRARKQGRANQVAPSGKGKQAVRY